MLSATLALSILFAPPQIGHDLLPTYGDQLQSDLITVQATTNQPVGFATLGTKISSGGDLDLLVVRMDAHNNVLWKRTIGGSALERPGNLIQTQDGGLLVACLSLSTPSPDQRAVLIKLDEDGAIQWSRSYRADSVYGLGHTASKVLVAQADGGHLVLLTPIEIQLAISKTTGHFLLDPGGTPIMMFKATPSQTNFMMSYEAICHKNGKIAVAGHAMLLDPQSMVWTVGPFVAMLNDIGTTQWSKIYPWPSSGENPALGAAHSIQFTANNDLIIAGSKLFSGLPDEQTIGGNLMRIQEDGTHLWTKYYHNLTLKSAVEDADPADNPPNDTLNVIGHRLDGNLEFGTRTPSMMTTSSTGVPLRMMNYTALERGFGVDLVQRYASAGYATDGVVGLSGSMWHVGSSSLHWIKANPTLATGCFEEEHDQQYEEIPVEVSPVPYTFTTTDGSSILNWDAVDPEIAMVDPCEVEPFYPICFGDGFGTDCPCSNTGQPGEGCANSATPGVGALLNASGTPSVSADTFALTITQGIPSQPVLFFQGMNFINGANGNHFGDGLRCCGGGVKRLEVQFMDASGSASSVSTLSIAGAVSAGTTYCNQGWYRDPPSVGGSPCSNFFNLTSALSVTWLP